jgi:hypothetical protein
MRENTLSSNTLYRHLMLAKRPGVSELDTLFDTLQSMIDLADRLERECIDQATHKAPPIIIVPKPGKKRTLK